MIAILAKPVRLLPPMLASGKRPPEHVHKLRLSLAPAFNPSLVPLMTVGTVNCLLKVHL